MSLRDKYKNKFKERAEREDGGYSIPFIRPSKDIREGDSFLLEFSTVKEGKKGSYGEFVILDLDCANNRFAVGKTVYLGGYAVMAALEEEDPPKGQKIFVEYGGKEYNKNTGNSFHKWEIDFVMAEGGSDESTL